MSNLRNIADIYFKNNTNENVCIVTNDGLAFGKSDIKAAKFHAKMAKCSYHYFDRVIAEPEIIEVKKSFKKIKENKNGKSTECRGAQD